MNNPEVWIAGFVAVGGLGAWLAALTFHAGKHSQRLDTARDDIKGLKVKQDEHSNSIAAWTQALNLLEEVRHDVKNLLTGKVQLSRRRSTGQAD